MLNKNDRPHLLSARDVTREELSDLMQRSRFFKRRLADGDLTRSLNGRIVATLFFQPSTRTRLSFESATRRLGGSCMGFADADVSKAGGEWRESMADTARVLNGYVDAVVIRHSEVGAVNLYAQESTVPVINGGDGRGPRAEHPTQAMIDLFSMDNEFGRVDGLKILIVGHVAQRCVHSLLLFLASFESVEIYLLTENGAQISEPETEELRSLGLNLRYVDHFDEVIERVDAIYAIGAKSPTEIDERLVLTPEVLRRSPRHARVYHPLPRGIELPSELDASRKAAYFEQVANGVPVRMAVLDSLLSTRH